mmetsp:Transcript_10037/g.22858  ORF Transcript_10037/g.22858 Transcript_10037/m.22858 type:complete len:223 (-) Transcript_10037:352-1020(-)
MCACGRSGQVAMRVVLLRVVGFCAATGTYSERSTLGLIAPDSACPSPALATSAAFIPLLTPSLLHTQGSATDASITSKSESSCTGESLWTAQTGTSCFVPDIPNCGTAIAKSVASREPCCRPSTMQIGTSSPCDCDKGVDANGATPAAALMRSSLPVFFLSLCFRCRLAPRVSFGASASASPTVGASCADCSLTVAGAGGGAMTDTAAGAGAHTAVIPALAV